MAAKPQLTIYDGVGARNKDLDASIAQFTSTGSWKRQRVIFIIPSADMIPAKVALAYWNLAFPPNNGVVRILATGMEVGDAYSSAIEQVLAHPDLSQWEYICTAEHDNLVPADGIIKLIEKMEAHPEFACIGGLYWTKGPGGVPQIWGSVDPAEGHNYRPQKPDPNGGLVECAGTGMGFNLWRLAMFKDERIKRPWFRTLNGKDGVGIGTQDLTFWTEARKHGYRCAVACDVKVGHLDHDGSFGIKDFSW
jgi:hypothetical protein